MIRQHTAKNPLIDMELFRKPGFRAPMLVNLCGNFVLMGFSLFNTQYLQSVAGMRPFTAALWSMAAMPFVSVGMGVTGALTTKVRPGRIIGVAFLVSSAGALVLTLVHPGNPIVVLLIGAGVAAGGVVAAQSIVGNMVMAAAPAERAGSASALNETGAELGSSLGMALLGSIGAAIYHHKMQTVGAAGAPEAAVRAGHETVGGADALAAQFPGPATHALLTTARDAYASGLHTAAGVGAVVLFLTALFAFRALRNEPVLPPRRRRRRARRRKTARTADASVEPAADHARRRCECTTPRGGVSRGAAAGHWFEPTRMSAGLRGGDRRTRRFRGRIRP